MFTFNDILERLKAAIQTKETLIEGFFTMTNLRAVAQEFNLAYAEMDHIEHNYVLTTATGRFLDDRAVDYGIERKLALKAHGRVTFTGSEEVEIPAGTVVIGGGERFQTLRHVKIAGGTASVEAEALNAGARGNIPAAAVHQMETLLGGVMGVTNEEAFAGGTDTEGDESLRARIFEKIRKPITSGNVNHYKFWASSVAGVGRVKIMPLWNGPGTVKVSILNAQGGAADADLIRKVQDYISPAPGTGEGEAPVGAIVTVSTAKELQITVEVEGVQLDAQATGGMDAVRGEAEKAVREYLLSLAYKDFADSVSPAQLGHIVLGVRGMRNYRSLKVNGSATEPCPIGAEEIPVLASLRFSQEGL